MKLKAKLALEYVGPKKGIFDVWHERLLKAYEAGFDQAKYEVTVISFFGVDHTVQNKRQLLELGEEEVG